MAILNKDTLGELTDNEVGALYGMQDQDRARTWTRVDGSEISNGNKNGNSFEYNGRYYKTHVDKKGRVCTQCGIYKYWREFAEDTNSGLGHNERCKLCARRTDNSVKGANGRGEKHIGRQVVLDNYRWKCTYDPTSQYDHGHFRHNDFVESLDGGVWPVGSIWWNKDTGEEIEIKTIAVTLVKGHAKKRIREQRNEAELLKPVVGLRELYR